MNTRKGFTLVELLVVIAILAILATVSVVGYTSFITRANQSNVDTEAHQIASYLNANLMANEATELAEGVWVVKTTEGALVATTEKIAEDEDEYTQYTGDAAIEITNTDLALDGTLTIKEDTDGKMYLVYTLNGVSSNVIEVQNEEEVVPAE